MPLKFWRRSPKGSKGPLKLAEEATNCASYDNGSQLDSSHWLVPDVDANVVSDICWQCGKINLFILGFGRVPSFRNHYWEKRSLFKSASRCPLCKLIFQGMLLDKYPTDTTEIYVEVYPLTHGQTIRGLELLAPLRKIFLAVSASEGSLLGYRPHCLILTVY